MAADNMLKSELKGFNSQQSSEFAEFDEIWLENSLQKREETSGYIKNESFESLDRAVIDLAKYHNMNKRAMDALSSDFYTDRTLLHQSYLKYETNINLNAV